MPCNAKPCFGPKEHFRRGKTCLAAAEDGCTSATLHATLDQFSGLPFPVCARLGHLLVTEQWRHPHCNNWDDGTIHVVARSWSKAITHLVWSWRWRAWKGCHAQTQWRWLEFSHPLRYSLSLCLWQAAEVAWSFELALLMSYPLLLWSIMLDGFALLQFLKFFSHS